MTQSSTRTTSSIERLVIFALVGVVAALAFRLFDLESRVAELSARIEQRSENETPPCTEGDEDDRISSVGDEDEKGKISDVEEEEEDVPPS